MQEDINETRVVKAIAEFFPSPGDECIKIEQHSWPEAGADETLYLVTYLTAGAISKQKEYSGLNGYRKAWRKFIKWVGKDLY